MQRSMQYIKVKLDCIGLHVWCVWDHQQNDVCKSQKCAKSPKEAPKVFKFNAKCNIDLSELLSSVPAETSSFGFSESLDNLLQAGQPTSLTKALDPEIEWQSSLMHLHVDKLLMSIHSIALKKKFSKYQNLNHLIMLKSLKYNNFLSK